MIRVLLGSAAPLLGLGAAIALLGPDLVTGPRGEPLVVSSPARLALQPVLYEGDSCARSRALEADILRAQPAMHVVTLALRYGPDGASIAVESGVAGAEADAALVLAFDGDGRILSVSEPVDCLPDSEAEAPSRI